MIVLAGMIGVGKTTYTSNLADELGTTPFYEPVETNPILDKYYEDPERYGFSLQIYFLNKRFKSIKEAYREDNNVLDRSIYEDSLFTYINTLQGNISEEEFRIYQELLDNMLEELEGMPKKAPDLLIFLDGSFEHIMDNIRKRGRVYEQPSDDNGLEDYYRLLYDNYTKWFEDYDHSAKLRIVTDGLDANNPSDWKKIYGMVEDEMIKLGIK